MSLKFMRTGPQRASRTATGLSGIVFLALSVAPALFLRGQLFADDQLKIAPEVRSLIEASVFAEELNPGFSLAPLTTEAGPLMTEAAPVQAEGGTVVLEVRVAENFAPIVEYAEGLPGATVVQASPQFDVLTLEVERSELQEAVAGLAAMDVLQSVSLAPVFDKPVVLQPFNVDAQDSHQVPELRAAYSVDGTGVVVGVWDEARVVADHDEFDNGRIQQIDSPAKYSVHMTHVTGTVGASGFFKDAAGVGVAQGMSPKVSVRCFDWFSDSSELLAEAGQIACSNHSYGPLRGWNRNRAVGRWEWWGGTGSTDTEDRLFGKYDGTCRDYDRLVRQNPSLCVFVAAGNERGAFSNDPFSDPTFAGEYYLGNSWTKSTVVRKSDLFDKGGLDTIAGFALAKNVITIGAIEDVLLDPPTADLVSVTNFSSWGPTDDFRIKPDVVANGALLFSPTYQLNAATGQPRKNAYTQLSGTSMAAPAACSIGALLHQVAKQEALGRFLFADEMKAVLVHEAIHPDGRPTPQLGYGSIMADASGEIVAGDRGAMHRDKPTSAGYRRKGTATVGRPIRVTVAWIDPEASPDLLGPLDDPKKTLVHDLDLVVTAPDGSQFFPWALDPAGNDLPARRDAANHADNLERVDVDAARVVAGEWTVEVTGAGAAENQDFALIVTGLDIDLN